MVIVMTTKAVERGRAKCGQYWPPEEDGEEQHENFLVINTRMEVYQDYSITWLFLLNTKSNESRQIYHLQFTSWPDYGTPSSAAAFLEFLFKVRACQEEAVSSLGSEWQGHALGPPIVVHCSAGIGRTGTFITTDISLRRLEHIQTVNIRETVRRIRSQRAFSIQMPDQYVFCHFAIIEHGMQEGVVGDVDWTGFDDSDSDMSDWGHLHFTHHGTQWDKVCHVVQCFDVCHLKKGSHVIMPHDGICFCYDLISVIDILFVLFIFFLYKFIWYICSRFVIGFFRIFLLYSSGTMCRLYFFYYPFG